MPTGISSVNHSPTQYVTLRSIYAKPCSSIVIYEFLIVLFPHNHIPIPT